MVWQIKGGKDKKLDNFSATYLMHAFIG